MKKNSLYESWLRASIRTKFNMILIAMFLSIIVAAGINIYIMTISLQKNGDILTQITQCQRVQEALDEEESQMRTYMMEQTAGSRKDYEKACTRTAAAIEQLPFSLDQIDEDRYARTWNLRNGYEHYAQLRDEVVDAWEKNNENVRQLYDVYDIQSYLSAYAGNLTELAVNAASDAYDAQRPIIQSIPSISILLAFVVLLAVLTASRSLNTSVVEPIRRLSVSAAKIADRDFSEKDISVPNKDEVGRLVASFNTMKHSTEENIKTLEENQKLSEQLHKDEMERARLENQLETAKLDLLKSQINPHFLFNTLGTIAGMAEIEDADGTRRMIQSLSNIFRYNLHTTDSFIALSNELSVCRDYLFLQKMRFGSRLNYSYEIAENVNPEEIMVPVFCLQPLIENAISHGIIKKEQGGEIVVRVTKEDNRALIVVADTGVGIPKDKLQRMRRELESGQTGTEVHIGVGNIYRRIHSIYKSGNMTIDSLEGEGTRVTLVIPCTEETGKIYSGLKTDGGAEKASAEQEEAEHADNPDCGR